MNSPKNVISEAGVGQNSTAAAASSFRPAPDPLLRFTPVTVKVRCCGGKHTISLDRRGRLILHNHRARDLRHEEAFMELGGQGTRCGAVLRAWQGEWYSSVLPPALQRAARAARAIRMARRQTVGVVDPLAVGPLLQRPAGLTVLVNRLVSAWMPGLTCVVTGPPKRGAYSFTLRAAGFVLLRLDVDQCWAETVLKAGLAVVDGGLTLRVRDRTHPWVAPGDVALDQLRMVSRSDGVEIVKSWRRFRRGPAGDSDELVRI